MATATVTPDQETVLAEIFIAAPPERVFQAISDPEQLSRWWGVRTASTASPNAPPTFAREGKWPVSRGIGADGTKFSVEGEYLEVDPLPPTGPHLDCQLSGTAQNRGLLGSRSADRARTASQWPEEGRHWHDGPTPSRGFRRRAAVRNQRRG